MNTAPTNLHDGKPFSDRYGIYYDIKKNSHMIGNKEVSFEDDDIFVNDKKYKGTKGLWILLTSVNAPNKDQYEEEDYENYKQILFQTDCLYERYDPKLKARSNRGDKWNKLVKYIWAEKFETIKKGRLHSYTGSAIKKYSEKPIEYKYIDNLSQLINRLYYIASQEQAGNNNFHNEKLGVLRLFTNEMEKLIDKPKGTEYLISYVSSLPKKVMKGSGLMNDIINNLPFEMHYPGYNYLGPGTKLDKRLARDDKPINKLDEAAKEHDIFYKHHKNVKDRHHADLILENKAWNQVLDPNSNIGEKTAAYITTNAMKLKRYFGMGLK